MLASPDPFRGLHDEGNGVPDLRSALIALRAGRHEQAAEFAGRARTNGLPAEARPHAAVLAGVLACEHGSPADAITQLRDAWSAHPDFAALPAVLGAALRGAGEHEAAAKTLYAAILTDDPEGSLDAWRPLLQRLL